MSAQHQELTARAEVDVAVSVMAELFIAGLMRDARPDTMREAARSVRVPLDALKLAILARRSVPYAPPTLTFTSLATSALIIDGPRRRLSPVPAPPPSGEQRECNMCKRTKPIEEFALRRTKKCPDMRWYYCRDCGRAGSRMVGLRAAETRRNNARLRFELQQADALGGLTCEHCAEPLVAGDEVVGETELAHVHCHGEVD